MGDAGSEHGDDALEGPVEGLFRGAGDSPLHEPFDGHLDDGPDGPFAAPPHPLDRLWLHPSELAPFAGASSAPGRSRPTWVATVVAGATGAILTIAVLGAVGALRTSSKHPSDPTVAPTSAPIATAQVVAISVGPAVVAVSVHDASHTRRGSGVCIRRSGEVLTSARLIGKATKIAVKTSDGAEHPAKVIGRDASTDLVLLALGTRVPIAQFAPHTPRVLDTVWVVGAPDPGGKQPWMTSGEIASTDSLLSVGSGPTTSGLLETAASSTTGASGGALVDGSGNVTGIVLAPVGNDRMTYAIPIATALSIAKDLRLHGYVTHGALGIAGMDEGGGPTVTGLVAHGPADRAGIKVGDVVRSVDGHDVESMGDVMALVREDHPGRRVTVVVGRGARSLTVHAILTGVVPS